MDRLSALETFITTLDEGSLNRASKRRNVSQSAVSQQIRSLETLLDQELLLRSSSGVRPTQAGELVYEKAQVVLNNFNDLLDGIEGLRDTLTGTFRISVATYLGRILFGPPLIDLNTRYPELDLVIRLEDRLIDVVREGYDLAIRTGALGDTDGISRKIGSIQTTLFAAPEYLERHGHPSHPDDLRQLRFIQFHENAPTAPLELHRNDATYMINVPVGITVGSPDLILRAVEQGAGFSRAPTILIEDALEAGTLVEVLPEYKVPMKDVHAIYPSRTTSNRRLETVVEAIRSGMSECKYITLTSTFRDS